MRSSSPFWFSVTRVLALCGLFGAFAIGARAQGQNQGEPNIYVHEFGKAGDPGSLKVWFYDELASVWVLQMRDEPSNAVARKKASKTDDDYYLASQLPSADSPPSLTLSLRHARDGVSFTGPGWRRVEGPQNADEVRWTRDCGGGVTAEKVFRHVDGFRGLHLELRVSLAKGATARTDGLYLRLQGLYLLNPEKDYILGANPGATIAVSTDGQDEIAKSARAGAPPEETKLIGGDILFGGTTNRFFGAFMLPLDDASRKALESVHMAAEPARNPIPGHRIYSIPVAQYNLDLAWPPPGESTAVTYGLYIGPKHSGVFGEREEYAPFAHVTDLDLSPICFCDIPGARPMAKLLLFLLNTLHGFVSSWGVAIILLTILVRTLMLPLNFRMQKSMRAYGAKMMRLKPQLEKLQAKYKQDPKKHQAEMVAFQREHKLFPPLGGCLPMLLISFPVFIGLFTALRVAYELRAQPFMWVPDLSAPDALFELGWGFMPYFNILPIIMVALWMVLQFSTPLPKDPQQRQMMKIMRFLPLLFGVMLYNYASGLMVYMITSSCYALVETRVTKRILGPMPTEAAGMAPTTF